MRSSEHGNLPRWRGETGFFEIWFLVAFAPSARRAWWIRYTTFVPAPGAPGAPRATLWAAVFDAAAAAPALAVKQTFALDDYDAGQPGRFAVRVGPAVLSNAACRGEARSGAHTIAWDLAFAPAVREARRSPRLLDRLPLPTHVSHANDDVTFSGWVSVDGARHALDAAPGTQKHIWGTRRVAELLWLYCPRFAEDPEARLEATSVRPQPRRRAGMPPLTPVWLRTAGGDVDRCGWTHVFANRLETPAPGELRLRSASATTTITARAWCDPRTLVGYVYRDPAGWDVHVAQSDLASCELELRTRPHPFARWRPPRRLSCDRASALEIHAPEPLPGVRYLPWDGTGRVC